MQPDTQISVKMSREDAGAISMTRVMEQRVALSELVRLIVNVTGKDHERVQGILARGSFVSGVTRMRWKGFPSAEVAEACLRLLPDPMPGRTFVIDEASHVEVTGWRVDALLEVRVLKQQRWFHRETAWQAIRAWIDAQPPQYERYDYEAGCDRFAWEPDAASSDALSKCWRLLPDRGLRRHLTGGQATRLVFLLPR